MNAYPFLDSKLQPISDAELGDIVRPARKKRTIDISGSPFVPASELRSKLEDLLMAGELDSGLPILRDGVLTGLIPAPDLEYALDTLGADEDHTICLMSMDSSIAIYDSENEDLLQDDFTRYIDPVSHGLDFHFREFFPGANAIPTSLLSPLMFTLLSILSTNASPSLVSATSVSYKMDNMLVSYIRSLL
jgi:hypothetical protein